MKRTYLLSMLVLGIAVAAVGLGTYAQLTATQALPTQLDTKDFNAGSRVTDAACSNPDNMQFTVSGLSPSDCMVSDAAWTTAGYVTIWNDQASAKPADVSLAFDGWSTTCAGLGDDGYDKFLVRFFANPNDFAYSTCIQSPYSTWWWGPVYQPQWNAEIAATDLDSISGAAPIDFATYNLAPIPPAQAGVIKVQVCLAKDAGNNYKNCVVKFNAHLTETQNL